MVLTCSCCQSSNCNEMEEKQVHTYYKQMANKNLGSSFNTEI